MGNIVLEKGKAINQMIPKKIIFKRYVTQDDVDLSGTGADRIGELLVEFELENTSLVYVRSIPISFSVNTTNREIIACSSEAVSRVPAATGGPGSIAVYGDGKRCINDKFISGCGNNPGSSWQFNICSFKSNTDREGVVLEWNSDEGGYRMVPAATPGGTYAGINFKADITCTEGFE